MDDSTQTTQTGPTGQTPPTDQLAAVDEAGRTTAELEAVLAELGRLTAAVRPADHGRPTPCSTWTVGELQQHVVQWLTAFGSGFADPDGRAPDAAGVEVTDPTTQVAEASGTLLTAVRAGAAGRPLDLGGAAMPGAMALQMILWEYQVHGWDLARATGQHWSPAESGLQQTLDFAPAMLTPDFQGEGKPFHPRVDVADGAPALDRVVALSGRDPRWSAPAEG